MTENTVSYTYTFWLPLRIIYLYTWKYNPSMLSVTQVEWSSGQVQSVSYLLFQNIKIHLSRLAYSHHYQGKGYSQILAVQNIKTPCCHHSLLVSPPPFPKAWVNFWALHYHLSVYSSAEATSCIAPPVKESSIYESKLTILIPQGTSTLLHWHRITHTQKGEGFYSKDHNYLREKKSFQIDWRHCRLLMKRPFTNEPQLKFVSGLVV